VEPKPGIPPSQKHVADLVELMRVQNISILFAANYFDHQKIRTVAGRVGAAPVIVPLYVGGAPNTEDYFKLVDCWTDALLAAAAKKGLITPD
jgi:ABC-type Zn uptake system ZnuABC Zn-binding protein ZnuA